MSHDSRGLAGRDRSRPHAPGQSFLDRGRGLPEHLRDAREVDRGSAVAQARSPDAEARAAASADRRPGRLSPEPPVGAGNEGSTMERTATGAAAPGRTVGGPWSWLTTVDHKRIGIMYGVTALVLLPGRRPRGAADPHAACAPDEPTSSSPESYNQLFTMHGTTMVFLVVMPLVGGVLQLPHAAADRRARRRVPAPQRLQLLGVRCWAASSSRCRASCSAARPTAAGSATRR